MKIHRENMRGEEHLHLSIGRYNFFFNFSDRERENWGDYLIELFPRNKGMVALKIFID